MAFFSIGARCKPWLQEFHVHIPQISVSFGAPNVSLIPTVWQHQVNLAAQIGERKVGRLCWPKCPLNVQRRLTVPVLSVRSRGYIWIEWAEIPGPLVLCCPGTAGMQNGVVSGLASPPPLFFSLFFLLVIQRVEEKSEEKEEGRAVCVCVCVCVRAQIVTEPDKFPTSQQYKSSDYSPVIALAARRPKSKFISVP